MNQTSQLHARKYVAQKLWNTVSPRQSRAAGAITAQKALEAGKFSAQRIVAMTTKPDSHRKSEGACYDTIRVFPAHETGCR